MTPEKFLNYISHEKRYSGNTLKAYQRDLEQYREFLRGNYSVENPAHADPFMIRSWIVHLIEQNITVRTVNRKLTTLRSFYRYLIKEGVLVLNPAVRISPPRQKQKLPVFVEKESMEELFSGIEFREGFAGSRDRLLLEVLYGTGMRLAELAGLKDRDIDEKELIMKVTGKRNKQRIIPFTNKMGSLIHEYREERSREFGSRVPDYFFLTDKGKAVYPKMVYRIVNKYLSQVTTIRKRSPHVLRHTFATHMLNNGADLNAIKEILGHSNLAATQVYTHNSIEKLKTIYDKAHPKA